MTTSCKIKIKLADKNTNILKRCSQAVFLSWNYKKTLLENINKFLVTNKIKFYDNDSFKLDLAKLSGEKFNIYFLICGIVL